MGSPSIKITNGTIDVGVLASTPAGSENALLVRNIPSGTQTISGTVTQGTAAALSGYWPMRVTDGTNTMPTLDVVGRAGFFKITNGTNTATVDASGFLTTNINGTVTISGTVNQGTAAVTANAWPFKFTDGTNVVSLITPTLSTLVSMPVVNAAASLYLTTSQAATTATTQTLVVGALTTGTNQLFNAASVQVTVTNPAGAAQTITGVKLYFTDTINTQSVAINYVQSGVSIAAGSNQTFVITLNSGYLTTMKVDVTYGVAPTASGNIVVQSVVQSVSAASGSSTVAQGTKGSAGQAWYSQITDGTNFMPTLDAVGRAGFFKITNGTNTATVDASGFLTTNINGTVTISGTIVQGNKGSAAQAWYSQITDGTNFMPTMDVVGRAGFHKITDGTNTAVVSTSVPTVAQAGLIVRPIIGGTYNNIVTAATTTVKSGAGVLYRIIINSSGDTTQTAIIYDNTTATGTKIGTINLSTPGVCYLYDIAFTTGLTIVTSSVTNLADITIVYA